MAENRNGFEFHPMGLGSVLKSNKLNVPLYQREYSWNKDTVEQMLQDLATAKDEGSDYFLGTVVTIPNNKGGLDIVDGQQRLTTTALLISEMRNYFLGLPEQNMAVESIENDFLSIIDRRRRERIPRLSLNVDDNEYFADTLQRPEDKIGVEVTKSSHKKIFEATKVCREWIKKILSPFDSKNHDNVLNDWIEYIELRARVILLKAPDNLHAFKMFETLNDRGLKTSQLDLVKNYLFGEAGDRIVEAQTKWSSMMGALEELDDPNRKINFLRHTLIATKDFVRSDRVFNMVQKKVRGESSALGFLTELESLSYLYMATYHSDSSHWAEHPHKTSKAIRVLNRFDIKPIRPLILSIAFKFDPKVCSEALEYLVSFGVRLLIASRTTTGFVEGTLAKAALSVYNEEIKDIQALRKTLSVIAPSDEEFEEAFSRITLSKAYLARYYLRSLEQACEQESEPWVIPNEDPSAITLEHILPKRPNDGEWQEVEPDDVKRLSKKLGNMCLLQKTANSNLKSSEFIDKVEAFKESPYRLTKELAKFTKWDESTIQERQDRLAKLAVDTWKT